MVKSKVGITLNEDTLEKLNKQAENLGLTKSQFISLLINKNYAGEQK
jgi:Ribbon-helix-helix protein, copG family.